MKYSFFIGCVTPVMARQSEVATRRVAKELDIQLTDTPDFTCCGFPLKSVDKETALLLAARNLSVADELDLNVCTICTGCAGTLIEAKTKLEENDNLRREVNKKLVKIGREYNGDVNIKHFARILHDDVGLETIKTKIKNKLGPLKIASHYGCHYHKPSRVYGRKEDVEFPTSMDELVTATGAKSIDYENKMQCCGGNVLGIDENVTYKIASQKLDNVKTAGADAISLICPQCDIIYDRSQRIIARQLNKNYETPVLFYPQILGLALGIKPEELGFNMNRVTTSKLLGRISRS